MKGLNVVICTCGLDRRDHGRLPPHPGLTATSQCRGFVWNEKHPENDRRVIHKECAWCWKPKRQWRNPDGETIAVIHLIEALADSAVQSIVAKNPLKAMDRNNRILKVVREIISRYPETNFMRCKFIPEKSRAKCNKPLRPTGECPYHGQQMDEMLDKFYFGDDK